MDGRTSCIDISNVKIKNVCIQVGWMHRDKVAFHNTRVWLDANRQAKQCL